MIDVFTTKTAFGSKLKAYAAIFFFFSIQTEVWLHADDQSKSKFRVFESFQKLQKKKEEKENQRASNFGLGFSQKAQIIIKANEGSFMGETSNRRQKNFSSVT